MPNPRPVGLLSLIHDKLAAFLVRAPVAALSLAEKQTWKPWTRSCAYPSLDVALSLRVNPTSVPAAPTSRTSHGGRLIRTEACPSICAPFCLSLFCSGTVSRRWFWIRTTSRISREARWSGSSLCRAQVSATLLSRTHLSQGTMNLNGVRDGFHLWIF